MFYVLTFLVQLVAALILSRVASLNLVLSLRTVFASAGIGCFLVAWTLSGREGDVFGSLWAVRTAASWNSDVPVAETPDEAERTASNLPRILILTAYGAALLILAYVLPG